MQPILDLTFKKLRPNLLFRIRKKNHNLIKWDNLETYYHVTKSFIDESNSHNLSKGANSSTCDNKLNALHHAKLTNIHFGFN